jgi:hypothetical protein
MGVVNNPQEETGMAEGTGSQGPTQSLAQMPPNFDEQGGESPVAGESESTFNGRPTMPTMPTVRPLGKTLSLSQMEAGKWCGSGGRATLNLPREWPRGNCRGTGRGVGEGGRQGVREQSSESSMP